MLRKWSASGRSDPYRFSMARAVAAYLFVRGGRDAAARIARFDGDNAGCLLHVVFHTPETPSGEKQPFLQPFVASTVSPE